MKNQRICILSYQTIHRKTYDALVRLKAMGYSNVCVYAKPFHYVKKYTPLITHRPEIEKTDPLLQNSYISLIENLGFTCVNITTYEEIKEKEDAVFLICGAGIIPESILHKYKIINAHPGYLPMERGLDALKWAIVEHEPIGVTTHILGDATDAGQVIERRKVSIYQEDTFHAVAYRQYELEIQMLVDAVEKVNQIAFFASGDTYPIHRRMPHEIEKTLLAEFEKYKLDNTVQNKEDGNGIS